MTGWSFANTASRKVSISLRCPLRRAHSVSMSLTRSAALWKRSVRLLYFRLYSAWSRAALAFWPTACRISSDTYYLVGFHDYRQQVAKFRVDRIVQMEVTDETAVKKPKGFDVSEFFTQEFSMLNGKTCCITLLCENTLMNSIIDRFGEDVPTQIVDENHFGVETTVNLSSNFFGWVFASGGKMRITAPQEAVDGFQRMLENFSER